MTIDQVVRGVWLAFLAVAPLFLWLGWRRVATANRLRFYLLRRQRAAIGWRLILVGVVLLFAAVAVFRFGPSAAYVLVPPTPSITPSPTVTATPTTTQSPTVSLTPRISLTPSLTPTPTSSVTPSLPEALQVFFQETVTPRPEVLFSPILVAERLTPGNLAVDPRDEFDQPPPILYGAFSYDNLDNGVRWTALWYLGNEIICYESKPWDGGTGGYGYTECSPPEGWRLGEYEVQMFAGTQWRVSARFTITSLRPTATPSGTPTPG